MKTKKASSFSNRQDTPRQDGEMTYQEPMGGKQWPNISRLVVFEYLERVHVMDRSEEVVAEAKQREDASAKSRLLEVW